MKKFYQNSVFSSQFSVSRFSDIRRTHPKSDNLKTDYRRPNTGAFTLLELLIVIAIIGILAGLFLTTYPAAQKRARDARRQSDIKQYQTAVEKYANSHNGNYYPSGGSTVDPSASVHCTALLNTTNCPTDPKNSAPFVYQYNGTTSPSPNQYVLWARLEAQSGYNFVTCSNGKTGTTNITPSSSACPL